MPANDQTDRPESVDARSDLPRIAGYRLVRRLGLGGMATVYLAVQESLDRVTRYVEDLDSIRERAQIVKDELSNALSDRLNKNLYILSVISAIFLPLGFFTGLMGINIGGMPGVNNADAFWIFSGILVVMVAIQISIFKLLKWF